jgi:putative hydrolase of the HAD superfamily
MSRDQSVSRRASTLILDVGGVVIPSLLESVDVPGFPNVEDADWTDVRQGRRTERDYWAMVASQRPDLDISRLWKDCSRVRDELRSRLDTLAEQVRLVAFTNDMEHFFGPDWPNRFPELYIFDELVEARKIGRHKPDPDAFRAVAAAVGERPERCILVDDLDSNLHGACAAGMHTRLFDIRDPAGSIAAVLSDLAIPVEASINTRNIFRTSTTKRVRS